MWGGIVLGKMTHSIMILSIMIFSIMALNKMTLSIMTLSISTFSLKINETRLSAKWHSMHLAVVLSVTYAGSGSC